jgi:hypothetical protein
MKTLLSFILLFFAALLISCGKTNVITNTYSTAEPGNIKGKVILYDTNGVLLSDFSGVKVAMEGTSYSILTATDGTWELQNVPAGTYPSLMYSKVGFPTYKSYQSATQGQQGTPGNIGAYIIGGGGTQYDGIQNFYQISNISVDLVLRPFDEDYKKITYRDTLINSNATYVIDTLVIPNGQAIFSSRVLDNPPNKVYPYYGVLFFGKSPNIDPADTKSFLFESCYSDQGYYAYQYYPRGFTPTNTSTGIADFTVNKLFLQSVGFISGETVYCVAYFGNSNSLYYNYYIDPATGMIIFPGFSPYHSEVKSFILP